MVTEPATPATLTVLRPGFQTLVVDFGRPHCRSLGVPLGGAADRTALALGNALVGNAPDAPALEITLTGPTLVADASLACVLMGGPFELTTDRRTLASSKSFTLASGEELRIGASQALPRSYFCVRGGLSVPVVLGSRSSLEPLTRGAKLPCSSGQTSSRRIDSTMLVDPQPRILMALPGRQADSFAEDEFYERAFTVASESNRMGLRLRGEPLALPHGELVSEPVCPGSVQVTRDGQCVVLGVDGQTIGGYPKIAQVISADMDRVGRLRPGDEIRFQRVSLKTAENLHRRKQAELREWLLRLRVTAERS